MKLIWAKNSLEENKQEKLMEREKGKEERMTSLWH